MNCPHCKKSMIVLELEQVEIDHCLSCSGIWLDAGELELLLGSPAGQKTILHSFHPSANVKENKRRCPVCFKSMQKINCGTAQEIFIDKCPAGHGLWFDTGELERILLAGNLDKEGKSLALLQKMFAKKLNPSSKGV